MYNRIDLEEAIMEAWHTTEDLNYIAEANYGVIGQVNALNGLSIMHNIRMEKLFRIFESLVPVMDSSKELAETKSLLEQRTLECYKLKQELQDWRKK